MAYLFNEFLYRPLLNLLFLIYNNVFADIGVAIIGLTLIIRFVLLPLFYKSAKDQTILQSIAPKIKEIQATHKDDKEKQVKEIMNVYKEHKVNPFSGFLLLFIQLPILIALYRVFLRGFSRDVVMSHLYSFVVMPEFVHTMFLGLVNLEKPNLILVLAAGLFQYLQSKLLLAVSKQKKSSSGGGSMAMAEKMSRQMMLFTPIITVVILYSLPAAVALYWLTTSVFSVIQQIIINKKIHTTSDYGNNEASA